MQDDSPELDLTDRRILQALQHNGRISNLELAQAVHLSPAQCNRRHKRLEAMGCVLAYEARLNPQRLGFGVLAFVHVTMERGHRRGPRQFADLVRDPRQVQECHAVTGDFDYVLKVVAEDLKSLSDFLLGTLMLLPGVGGARSSVCLDSFKVTAALPIDGV